MTESRAQRDDAIMKHKPHWMPDGISFNKLPDKIKVGVDLMHVLRERERERREARYHISCAPTEGMDLLLPRHDA